MNKSIVLLTGFLLISAGLLTGVYQTVFQTDMVSNDSVLEKILSGEEYLKQSGEQSRLKAVTIFSELSGKHNPQYDFRIRYNLGKALEKNGDKYRSLEIYQELNRSRDLTLNEQEQLGVSLGDLLLRMNRENEGRVHLDSVLRTSTDRKIRSQVFKSLGDYYYSQKVWETSRKNYLLAVQEDSNFTEAKIGLGRVLKKQGKDWAAFDLFDEYLDESSKMDGTDPKVSSEYKSDVYEQAKKYFANKQYYKAIEYFQKSVELGHSPTTVESSLYYIASSYDALGKQTEAIQYINKVLNNSVYTLDQEALYKKGTIYFKQGKFAQAANVFQVAVDKYPKNHVSERAIAWKKEALDQIREKEDFAPGTKTTDDLSKDMDDVDLVF
ncbi:tetratricopeptide repeat protein [Leptospira sp. GIMC2001]|uniref:tetratricopeptide repeat protein n=1 Tax=Leptospira sp. GIMC2001 TaxID=1513297 RepID=UPI0023497D58|nr:tetratricopeptide repeat protein [Leptospira sp. GIMC2001]WCL48446.1 tetratricopeptide repeat protein [Leptospira sp. GIMC2001]